MRRIIVALTALFSALLLTATVAPANAGDTTTISGSTERADRSADRAAKPKHTVRRLRAGEIRNSGRFFVRGNAVTYKGAKLWVQKAQTKNGRYRNFRADRTSPRTGVFRINFDGKVGTHWRVYVPGTRRYTRTFIYIGRICRNC